MKFIKTCLCLCLGLLFSYSHSFAQEIATPLFDALSVAPDNSKRGVSDERIIQCFLGAKVIEKSLDFNFLDDGSKKYIRAVEVAPVLELTMRDRAQTDLIFRSNLKAVKAEYDVFVNADKKQRKALYKIAKDTNKECTLRWRRAKAYAIGRSTKIATHLPGMTSEKAELCYAAMTNNISLSGGNRLDVIRQFLDTTIWNRAYVISKHREGFSADQKVAALKGSEAKSKLRELGAEQALTLLDECSEKLKKANFLYNLNKVKEEDFVFESALDWGVK